MPDGSAAAAPAPDQASVPEQPDFLTAPAPVAGPYGDLFQAAGEKYGVDPHLLASVVHVESGGNPKAVSRQGAQGLVQLMPETAARYKVDPFDPTQAIDAAARNLREGFDRYHDPELAVAYYHAGPNLTGWGPKTRDYVKKVGTQYAALAGSTNDASGSSNDQPPAPANMRPGPKLSPNKTPPKPSQKAPDPISTLPPGFTIDKDEAPDPIAALPPGFSLDGDAAAGPAPDDTEQGLATSYAGAGEPGIPPLSPPEAPAAPAPAQKGAKKLPRQPMAQEDEGDPDAPVPVSPQDQEQAQATSIAAAGEAGMAQAPQARPDAPAAVEPPDLTNKFNTKLSPEDEAKFQAWGKAQAAQNPDHRNPAEDTYDYDMRGFWKSGEALADNGHATDQFKKPNHPTFSHESIYSSPEMPGGSWITQPDGSVQFRASPFNLTMHDPGDLQQYFADREKGVQLVLPSKQPPAAAPEGDAQVGGPLPPAQSLARGVLNAGNQGMIEGTGALVRGAGRLPRTAELASFQAELAALDRADKGEPMMGTPEAPTIDDMRGYSAMTPEQRMAERVKIEAALQQLGAQAPNAVERAGTAIEGYGATHYPVEKQNEGIATNVARGIGSFGPAVAGAVAGGVAGTIIGGPVGGAIGAPVGAGTVFLAQTVDSTYKEAIDKGASPGEAAQAALMGGAAQGMLAGVPVARLMEKVPAPLRDGLLQTLYNFGKHAVEFGTFGAASRFIDNYVAQQTYDPERSLWEGIPQAAGYGALTGLVVPAGTALVKAGAERVAGAFRRPGEPEPPAPGAPGEPPQPTLPAPPTPPAGGPGEPKGGPGEPPKSSPAPESPPSSGTTPEPKGPEGEQKPPAKPRSIKEVQQQDGVTFATAVKRAAAEKQVYDEWLAKQEQPPAEGVGNSESQSPTPAEQTETEAPPQPRTASQIQKDEGIGYNAARKKADAEQAAFQAWLAAQHQPGESTSESQSSPASPEQIAPAPLPPDAGKADTPIHVEQPGDVEAAVEHVDPKPTPAQAEAGNYQKGHVVVGGLPISIENPKGSERTGVAPDGTPWSVTMPAHYGYIKGSEGADGDQLDVYLGPLAHEAEQHPVFIVDQHEKHEGNKLDLSSTYAADKMPFDEHKALLGFADQGEAIKTYMDGFSDGSGPLRIGRVWSMPFDQFKQWAMSPDARKPVKASSGAHETPPEQAITAAEAEGPGWRDEHPDVPATIFHGYDRENQADAYNPLSAKIPILGGGRYSAFSYSDAVKYGRSVDRAALDLKNPLVIRSDEQWKALTKAAGWEFPNPTGLQPDQVKAEVGRLKTLVQQRGHDGVVVYWDNASHYDQDLATGRSHKLLRNVFRQPQVVDYTRKGGGGSGAAPTPTEEAQAPTHTPVEEGAPAAERPRDANDNPIFEKGERVVLPPNPHMAADANEKGVAGRHGTIIERTGLVLKPIFGGKQSATSYHYTVETDAGHVFTASKLEPETGEPPPFVPDPRVGVTSTDPGKAVHPNELARQIAHHRSQAASHISSSARARKPEIKQELQTIAGREMRTADAKQKILDAWKAKYPDEAARIFGQAEEAPAPAPQPGAGGMHIVETKHAKKGFPLWVAVMPKRVSPERYKELVAAAKQGGGWYSAYRGEGAVPGFQFKSKEAAEAFVRDHGSDKEMAPAPPPPPPKPPPEKPVGSVWTHIGSNKDGRPLFEDQHGVRSITEDGVRITETVGFVPGHGTVVTPARDKEDRFKIADPLPGSDREVEYVPRWSRERIEQAVVDNVMREYRKGGFPAADAELEKWLSDGESVPISRWGWVRDMAYREMREAGWKGGTREGPPPQEGGGAPPEEPPVAGGEQAAPGQEPPGEQPGAGGAERPGADEQPKSSGYGKKNKAFTEDAAEKARRILREKLGQLRAGLDPELLQAGITLAGYHIEAGARRFADYSRAMIEDLGEAVRPFLRSWYESVRHYPGFEAEAAEMSSPAEIEELARGERPPISNPEGQGHGDQAPLRPGNEGTRPAGLPGALPGGEAGGAPANGGAAGQRPSARPSGTGAAERPGGGGPGRPAGGGGAGAGDVAGLPGAGEGAKPGTAGRPAPDANVKGQDFRIAPGEVGEDRGRMQKARDNLAAIELAKRLTAADAAATRAEQAVLVKYVGWGGLAGAFPDSQGRYGSGLEEIGQRLKAILPKKEYDTAVRSTQYAHYTAEHVIRSMWDAVRQMGFDGGDVFEPGMGVGHFLGMIPPDLAPKTHYQGVEMDRLTGQIAKLLYPQSGVRIADLTKVALPDGTFDMAIGNPPFGDIVISADPKYKTQGFLLHDYFFAKSLDAVRPGGLLAFVTSAGTMNKLDSKPREYMAQRAEFLGGIRLPSSAFKQNAGTEVTTDILFFKKRPATVDLADHPEHAEWTQVVPRTLPDADGGTTQGNVSRYFSEHPEMVLGREGFFDKLYKGRYAVHPEPGRDLAADLQEAIGRLPANVMTPPPSPEERAKFDFNSGQKKNGTFYIHQDGRLMQYSDGAGRPVAARGKEGGGFTKGEIEIIRHLIPVRDALRDVLFHNLADDQEKGDAARAALNQAYDAFVRTHGPINKADISHRRPTIIQQESARLKAREDARSAGDHFDDGDFDPTPLLRQKASLAQIAKARQDARSAAEVAGKKFNEGTFNPDDMPDVVIDKRPNIKPFMSDPESYRLRSIEAYDDESGTAEKRPIFHENILKKIPEPEIRSAQDAVLWSFNQYGRFDLDAITAKLGMPREKVIADLGDAIFRVPGTIDTFSTRDEYLSGDVVSKLETAKAAANSDVSFERNVKALEAALPPPLAPGDIAMMPGMPWMPHEYTKNFAVAQLKIGPIDITHIGAMGRWIVTEKYARGYDTSGRNVFGTEDRSAQQILEDVMNRTPPRITRTVEIDGKKHTVLDTVATEAAQERFENIKQAFEDWLGNNPEVHEELGRVYNDRLNRTVLRVYDGSYLTTPGVAADWSWRPHQTRVVARIVQSGNTYMAHAVGAGKTSAMIGATMEMRRLGLARKPMIVVPNHMLGQFAKEFYEQYPTARIMVADDQQFHTGRRKQFMADVAQGDHDAVIITHSSFGMIPISDDFLEGLIEEEIDKLEESLSHLDKKEDRITVKNLEAMKQKLEQKLLKARGEKKDQTLTFEEMGVDFLFVDEAHLFRKLSFATQQSSLKGVDPSGSEMAFDLYSKIRQIESQKPGRSVVLASGTPVTNTMGELYTLSRYIQRQALVDRGIEHFDSWAQTFGDVKTELEPQPDGGFKPVTRFSRFVNMPELYKMVAENMDIVTSAQLAQYVTRPTVAGGARQLHVAPFTDELARYQQTLATRMEEIRNRRGPPKKGDDIILAVINDGRGMAVDLRLVSAADNDPRSKLNTMIANVARIWRETTDHQFYDPGTGYEKPGFRGPATQMIFANFGVNPMGPAEFSAHKWIRVSLQREGIPPDQIAFISDYKTHLAKQALFNDVNEGKVRILVGTTQKMGTGVNAQRRLVAIHNLDPLWYPSDDEQRNGRGIRQGNWNKEIQIHDYTTADTYDSTMWGMMGRKGRFIEQFFRGDPELRDMEDLGEAGVFEQAAAMTISDPRVKQLVELRQALAKARRREQAHARDQFRLKNNVEQSEAAIRRYNDQVEALRKDIEQRIDTRGDLFKMSIDGEDYATRKAAATALNAAINDRLATASDGMKTKLADIGGFQMMMGMRRITGKFLIHYTLRLSGGREIDLHGNDESVGAGLIASAESRLRRFEEDIVALENMRKAEEKRIEETTPLLDKPFLGRPEIERMRRDVEHLEAELKPADQAKANMMLTLDDEPEPYDLALAPGVSTIPNVVATPQHAPMVFHAPIPMGIARKAVDELHSLFSPTSRPGAKDMEAIIRPHTGAQARSLAQVQHALEDVRHWMDRLPPDEQRNFTHRMETGQRQPSAELQLVADALRDVHDRWARMIQSLGKGYLQQLNENYMPHIWANYEQWKAGVMPPPGTVAGALQRAFGQGQSKRPIKGSGAFLKKRTFDTMQEGEDAGLVPVTTNPIVLSVLKLAEMQKMYHGTRMVDQIKSSGLARWVPYWHYAQADKAGMTVLNDGAFQPKMPIEIEHRQTVDPEVRKAIKAIADHLGVRVENPVKLTVKGHPNATGFSEPGVRIATQFGSAETLLMHEIGHALDDKYDFKKLFQGDPQAWQELGDLASLRAPPGYPDQAFLTYIQEPDERIANLFHAYWYAPKLAEDVAPTAVKLLEQFLSNHPALAKLVDDVKPSLQVQGETVTKRYVGLREMGKWYAPDPIATVFNRYVSTGLSGKYVLYDAPRRLNNALTQMQLALSAFHLTFVAVDTTTSRAATALMSLMHGQFAAAGKHALLTPISAILTPLQGAELGRAYRQFEITDPKMARLVNALTRAGGRVSMDMIFQSAAAGPFFKSLKDITRWASDPAAVPESFMHGIREAWGAQPSPVVLKAIMLPFRLAGRTLDTIMHPLMGKYVPAAKLGVFRHMYETWLERNPNATQAEEDAAIIKMWDSVDNRLGELVYDNLFWHHITKDIMHVLTRSVGWNTGTIREIAGGGGVDATKLLLDLAQGKRPDFTERMAYVIMMPIINMLLGALVSYLLPGGSWPKTIWDYFFPHFGGGRLEIPGYTKDVIQFWHDPVGTIAAKAAPIIGMAHDLINNRTGRGDIIYYPKEDTRTSAYGHYIAGEFTPWSLQRISRPEPGVFPPGQERLGQALQFFGIQPAPKWTVDSSKADKWKAADDKKAYNLRLKHQGQ